jgi:hypothetical protein
MQSQNPIGAPGGTLESESEYLFVVYDRGSGTIHHVHQVVNLKGAEARSQEQMELSALSHAPRQAQAAGGLAVLNVPPHQLQRGKFYRVDHERRTLVAEERRR